MARVDRGVAMTTSFDLPRETMLRHQNFVPWRVEGKPRAVTLMPSSYISPGAFPSIAPRGAASAPRLTSVIFSAPARCESGGAFRSSGRTGSDGSNGADALSMNASPAHPSGTGYFPAVGAATLNGRRLAPKHDRLRSMPSVANRAEQADLRYAPRILK